MIGFIKFFLQCIIEQCNNYIAKINRIKQIYIKDMKKLENLKSNAVYRIMPAIMRQIVFTKKEIEEESGVSRNTVSTLIDKLVELNILVPDSNYAKLSYRYNEIYNVFVGKDISWFFYCFKINVIINFMLNKKLNNNNCFVNSL